MVGRSKGTVWFVVGIIVLLLIVEAVSIAQPFLRVPSEGKQALERGKYLFNRFGCFSCHGPEGSGGIRNYNYVKDTIPELKTLAEHHLNLYYKEDALAILAIIERGEDPLNVEERPFPQYNVFQARYKNIKDTMVKGSIAGKKDPLGPNPPLNMPSWKERLSDRDMDCIVAHFISLYPWPEEE